MMLDLVKALIIVVAIVTITVAAICHGQNHWLRTLAISALLGVGGWTAAKVADALRWRP